MKLEDLIYDVKHMLMAFSKTTTVLDGDIIDKLAFYRMAYINQYYQKNRIVLDEWFQSLGLLTAETWNIFKIPIVPPETEQTYVTGGKVALPKIIQFPGVETIKVQSGDSEEMLYPIPFRTLLMMIELEDSRNDRFDYFSLRDNSIYTYPLKDVNVQAVLQDPTFKQASVVEEVANGELVQGVYYEVTVHEISYKVDDQIKTLPVGSIFLGTDVASWTDESNTAVVRTLGWVPTSYFDEYPIDAEGAQVIILEILTKDYAIRAKAVSDVIEDGVDQFKILTARR